MTSSRSFEHLLGRVQKNSNEVKHMALRKVFQMRKGTIALTIFKTETDGKVLMSLDKDFVSRRVKGPN